MAPAFDVLGAISMLGMAGFGVLATMFAGFGQEHADEIDRGPVWTIPAGMVGAATYGGSAAYGFVNASHCDAAIDAAIAAANEEARQ